ncbi:E3 ubiquitin-protein ligase UBR1-like protein [Gracilaria domingensis]|nr:E3 ubiquitin-protein ligase UBR1-like protein [Gracilaria domingensis]
MHGLPALKEAAGKAARNGVCGRVWREDELAYKCRTCERDPSCVICVPCFRNGNHEGHDYAMLRISGGCCDCGDDQAWQPSGFCCNHSGASPENEDLSAAMDAGLKRALIEAVTVIARSLYKSCTVLHEACRSRSQARVSLKMLIGSSYAELVVRTKSILKWLNEVVSCGDGIRRAVGLLLTSTALRWSPTETTKAAACDEDPSSSWLDLMLTMDGTGMLPDPVSSCLHTFYFELITDVVFRRIFLEKFAKNYPRFIHAQIVRKYDSQDKSQENAEYTASESDIVGSFTVQLFTVPALVPVMLQEGGLLEILLKLLCILFESASLPLSLYRQDVPFDQTNYVHRWLAAQSESLQQTMDTGDENDGGSASAEGRDERGNNISLSRLLAKHAIRPQPDENDGMEGEAPYPQVIDHETRDRLRLVLESDSAYAPVEIASPRAPRSESDASGNDDDDYVQYSSLPVHRMAAFEAGVRRLCPSIHCVVPSMQPDTGLTKAIVRARRNEEAALRDEVPLSHTMRVDWSVENSLGISDIWSRIMADLNYILSHPEVSFHVVHRRMDLFRLFVRLVSMFQGMHPLSRRMGDHVPTEPNLWFEGFRVEMETYHLAELLASGFCGNGNNSEDPANSMTSNDLSLKMSRLRAIGVVRKCLDDWLEGEEYREALSTYAGEFFTVAHAVSVHLPLHRLFSLFVHHAMRIDSLDLSTALTGDIGESRSGDISRLLIHPLRIQAFLAQERAKMWRRSGRIASFMSAYYRYPVYSEWFVDLDIFLQQCCAASMKTNEFISLAMKTFRIKDIPNLMDFVHLFQGKSMATSEESARTALNTSRESGSLENSFATHGKEVTGVDTGILPLVPITFKEDTPNGSIFVRAPSDPKEDIASFAPILLEGLMTFFVHITSERSLCGQSEGQNLRRKLLHYLCSQDRTHSQLCRVCSFRVNHSFSWESGETSTRNSQFLIDRVISSIATYIEPKKMEQGRYTFER